jgi:hypothetical protein
MNEEMCNKTLRQMGYCLLVVFFLSQIFEGILGGCFEFATIYAWEIWYGFVFCRVQFYAPDYFKNTKIRFFGSLFFVGFIEYCFLGVRMSEWGKAGNLSSEELRIFEIVHIVRICIYLVFFIWQIFMLMKAIAASMSAEQYERKRGKILLSLIFAPIGVILMRDEIKAKEDK